MPKIKWIDLPSQLRDHLLDRARERNVTMEDLFALEEWRRHSPDVRKRPTNPSSLRAGRRRIVVS
jgi:hypothetical protein